MRRTLTLATALVVTTALQAQVATPKDSVEVVELTNIQLDEIVVQGAQVVNKNDRKLITPSDELRSTASNGTDLVRRMQLPDIKVDPISGALSMASAGKLKLCINGRPVESREIQAMDPKQVARIEYHDNPSMRYGDVDLVLDFIVKSDQQGGRFSAMEQTVFTHGFEWQQSATLAINHKYSEFQVYVWNEHAQNFKMWRDNTETYHLADGSSFTRTETGIPTPYHSDNAQGIITYNYNKPEKEMLSINLSSSADWHNLTTFKGVLHSTLDNSDVLTQDESSNKALYPKLDVYYQRNLSENRLLYLNVVGRYTPEESYRRYMESTYVDGSEGEQLYDISSKIQSRSFSLLAEADYEQSWKGKRLTIGGRYNGSWTRSDYLDYNSIQHLQSHKGDVFAEGWWQILPSLDVTAGIGGTLQSFALRGSSSTTRWLWEPKLNIRYRLNGENTLRLNYQGKGTAPSLSQLSPVRQEVDGYQASAGNANLRPYMTHDFSFRYEYSHKSFYNQLMANYSWAHHPIMDEKYWDEGVVLSTYDNQKDFHKLSFREMVRETLIPNWLSVTGSLTWNRMISQGNRYCHTYNQWIPEASLELTHWNWTMSGQYQATPRKLWGEDVSMDGANGGNFHVLMVGYNYKQWQFNLIALNPFASTGGIESSNRNQYAGFQRNQRINFINQSLIVQVYFNINWGRQYQGGNKKVNNDINTQGASTAKK